MSTTDVKGVGVHLGLTGLAHQRTKVAVADQLPHADLEANGVEDAAFVGGFPVVKKKVRQLVMKITAYAERLLADLDELDWPESLKEMQRKK